MNSNDDTNLLEILLKSPIPHINTNCLVLSRSMLIFCSYFLYYTYFSIINLGLYLSGNFTKLNEETYYLNFDTIGFDDIECMEKIETWMKAWVIFCPVAAMLSGMLYCMFKNKYT